MFYNHFDRLRLNTFKGCEKLNLNFIFCILYAQGFHS